MSRPVLASLLASLLLAPAAWAANINTTLVRNSTNFWGGMTVDTVTGKVYESPGYQNKTQLTTYANAADFEAGISSGTLNTGALFQGTYLAAMNGTVYGRSGSTSGTDWDRVNGGTGALLGTHAISNLGGTNWNDSFDWGGYSAVNAISDGTNLYAVGGEVGGPDNLSPWRINRYDGSMNLLGSVLVTIGAEHPGFAFAMGGYLFLGDGYNNPQISRRVNTLTGAVEAVNFDLLGLGGDAYISNANYDALNDTLYLHSAGKYFKIGDAFAQFGSPQLVDPNDVPEPASLALAGLALLAAGGLRRKTRA